jgi:hypothetical protein
VILNHIISTISELAKNVDLEPHSRSTEIKTLGVVPSDVSSKEPSRGCWCMLSFENQCHIPTTRTPALEIMMLYP